MKKLTNIDTVVSDTHHEFNQFLNHGQLMKKFNKNLKIITAIMVEYMGLKCLITIMQFHHSFLNTKKVSEISRSAVSFLKIKKKSIK